MSGLRARSAVDADHRSVLPRVPGIPWWGAVLVAVTAAAIGVVNAAGSGNESLGSGFATLYVLGCLVAVLAVRQSGVFTALIQPPLILFVAVPSAYFVFQGSTFTGIKDLLIDCGYPLIQRFPLMFFTSLLVLAIGIGRWWMGAAARRAAPDVAEAADAEVPAETKTKSTSTRRSSRTATERPRRAAAAAAAATADDAPRAPRRSGRTPASASQRSGAAAAGSAAVRSRHARPPETEIVDPVLGRPRRRNAPPVDSPAEPRRRARAPEPRERRPLPPVDRRAAQERLDRYDRPQRRERPEPFDRPERPQRRPREPYEAPSPGSNGTHHPVSRVRYRGATEDEESRTEHRSRPRRPRHSAPDSWE